MSILKEANTPYHIKDCCGNEKQSCDHSAQNRLRIFENDFESSSSIFQSSYPPVYVISSFGSSNQSTTPIRIPVIPIPIQKVCQETPPLINGPTANCPAEPPAIPNICVAPIRVAAFDAGKYFVAIYTAPTSANTPPAPCSNLPILPIVWLPVAEEQCSDTNSNCPKRNYLSCTQTIHGSSCNKTERGVAKIEQSNH